MKIVNIGAIYSVLSNINREGRHDFSIMSNSLICTINLSVSTGTLSVERKPKTKFYRRCTAAEASRGTALPPCVPIQ
jgi:hypothetical protein